MTIVVYHWANGAYVNTFDPELFESAYAELCSQFGPPIIAQTYWSDWT